MTASIPFWVPALFLGLVFLGYRQSQPRRVKPGALVAIALAMLGLSLYGVVSAFGAQPVALLLWAFGYGIAVMLGAKYFASRGLVAEGNLVRIPGSWVPLVLFLAIFVAKFVLGFAAGVHSPLLQHIGFVAVMSGVLGFLSGGFGARAWAVHHCANAANVASV